MTDAVFAGATVGPEGIKPDLTKLTMIVDWKKPNDLSALESFLSLTGHFQDLIQNYSRIAAPLTDLKWDCNIPNTMGRAAYQHKMHAHELGGVWIIKHTKAFLKLKTLLISEPVLKGPQFDKSPFIVMSDGLGQGFGSSLSQRFITTLSLHYQVGRLLLRSIPSHLPPNEHHILKRSINPFCQNLRH
jgi:hypothetical protein